MSLRIKVKNGSKVEIIQCENLGISPMDLIYYEKLFKTIVKETVIEEFSPKHVYMVSHFVYILDIVKSIVVHC